MAKTLKKAKIIHSYFNQIHSSILEQRDIIEKLETVKNEGLLHSLNIQKDINLLKRYIDDIKIQLNYTSNSNSKIPLSNLTPFVHPLGKNIFLNLTNMFKLQVDDIVCSVKYTSNGYFFAYATYKTLYLYDSNTKVCIKSVSIPFNPQSVMEKLTRSISISPNSSLIALCAADFTIALFRLPTLKFIGSIQESANIASCVCFFNDNERIAVSGTDGKVAIWSIQSLVKEKETSLGIGKNIVNISVSADDEILIVTCSDGTVFVVDGKLERKPKVYTVSDNFVFNAALSGLGDRFAVSLRNNEVKLFSTIGGMQLLKTFVGHTDFVVCVEFSSDGQLLFTGSKDESVKIWNIDTTESIWTIPLKENTVFCVSHHPRKNEFIACTGDGIISIFSYIISP